MSLNVKFIDTPFVLAPAGCHKARCYMVVELGLQVSKAYQTRSPKLRIAWELPDKLMSDGQPLMVSATYNLRLTARTKLMGLLEGWRGKPFTAEERQQLKAEGFEPKRLLGLPCYLTLQHIHDPRYPQPWADVVCVSPLPSEMVCPPLINTPIYYDLDTHSEAAYLAVPEGIRKKINRGNKATVQVATAKSTFSPLRSAEAIEAILEDTVETTLADLPF